MENAKQIKNWKEQNRGKNNHNSSSPQPKKNQIATRKGPKRKPHPQGQSKSPRDKEPVRAEQIPIGDKIKINEIQVINLQVRITANKTKPAAGRGKIGADAVEENHVIMIRQIHVDLEFGTNYIIAMEKIAFLRQAK